MTFNSSSSSHWKCMKRRSAVLVWILTDVFVRGQWRDRYCQRVKRLTLLSQVSVSSHDVFLTLNVSHHMHVSHDAVFCLDQRWNVIPLCQTNTQGWFSSKYTACALYVGMWSFALTLTCVTNAFIDAENFSFKSCVHSCVCACVCLWNQSYQDVQVTQPECIWRTAYSGKGWGFCYITAAEERENFLQWLICSTSAHSNCISQNIFFCAVWFKKDTYKESLHQNK